MKFTLGYVICLVVMSLAGCLGGQEISNDEPGASTSRITSGTAALLVSHSIVGLQKGGAEEVQVEARDQTGNPTAFTVEGTSDCITVKLADKAFTVKALSVPCQASYEIVAADANLNRTIEVNGFDPMSLDLGEGLMMKYWNQYKLTGESRTGQPGSENFQMWHPANLPDGYHAVATTTVENGQSPNGRSTNVVSVILNDSNNLDLLAPPTGYSNIFQHTADFNIEETSAWLPNCPAGFVALGAVIVAQTNAPSVDMIRCVSSNYTVNATFGRIVEQKYVDGWDLVLREINDPLALPVGEDRVPISAFTRVPCGDDTLQSCRYSNQVLNRLLVPSFVVERGDNTEMELQLTAAVPLRENIPRFHTGVRMPFPLIPATSDYSVSNFVENGPFPVVFRTESFTTLNGGIVDNRQGSEPVTTTFSFTTGYEEGTESSFTENIGFSITARAGGGEATGGSFVSATYTHEFSSTRGQSYSYAETSTNERVITIPAGSFGQVVQVQSMWTAVNWNGEPLAQGLEGGSAITKILEFPLPER